jgi:hypothetical protein
MSKMCLLNMLFVFNHKNPLDNFFVYMQVTLHSVILPLQKAGIFGSEKLGFRIFCIFWVAGYHGIFIKKSDQFFFLWRVFPK